MKMDGLERLHQSMKAAGISNAKFVVQNGRVKFYCIFSVGLYPYEFALMHTGANPLFLLKEVDRQYEITPFFGDAYGELAKLLNEGAQSGNPLKPKEFFAEINNSLPKEITRADEAMPADLLRARPDIEDADKVYFSHYMHNPIGKGPSEGNLKKTLLLLGGEAREYSIRHRASSVWTDDPARCERITQASLNARD